MKKPKLLHFEETVLEKLELLALSKKLKLKPFMEKALEDLAEKADLEIVKKADKRKK